MSPATRFCLPILVMLLVPACSNSGGRQEVTGSISFDGEPLQGGWIYFRPTGKGPSSAGEIKNGRFEISAADGLMPGDYQVAIEYREPTGREVKVYTGETIAEEKQIIPARYNEQTTLKAEISSTEPNHFKFELQR